MNKNYNGKRKDFDGKDKKGESYSKNKSKGGFREPTNGKCDVTKLRSNDVSWYTRINDITKSANFYWSKIMGTPIHHENYTDIYQYNNTALPGIMTLDFVYGPGYANDFEDGVNRSFTQIMSRLYAGTSAGELPFTQGSLAMMMTSLQSIAVNLSFVRRNLNATKFWISRNINYPRALLGALGTDYEYEIREYANNVVRFNSLIRMFNNMKVPAFIDTFKRQISLFGNVWVDEDSPMGQIYVARPMGYYVYDDTQNVAEWHRFRVENYETSSMLSIISEQIARWYNSQDLYLINGTLLRAFKDMQYLTVPEYQESEMINPSTDKVMMSQFMNAIMVPYVGTGNLNIREDVVGNAIKWTPTFTPRDVEHDKLVYRYLANPRLRLLRAFDDAPTLDDNIEMTRLMPTFEVNEAFSGDQVFIHTNGEILCEVTVTSVMDPQPGASLDPVLSQVNISYQLVASSLNFSLNQITELLKLGNFRYIPLIYFLESNGDTVETLTANHTVVLGDMYNYTDLSITQLENLNWLAQQSIYLPSF